MSIKKLHHFGKLLFVLSLFSGFFFSSIVSADDSVIDDVNVAVPASCSLSGIGMTSHNAAINNGTYNSAIGETTMKAFCNDNEGFAVYAIGYTDDTDGKNVLTSNSLGSTYDITTGTATSGSNSNWAMKLSTITSPTPTYPITIENSFNNFHNVPNDYTLVAKRTSATDIGQNAEGSTLKSTYQAYISKTQAAGTYIGQVKYVLVHPNNTEETPVKPDQIAVIYDGNGLTFSGGTSTNKVIYGGENCNSFYVGNNPTLIKSPNLGADGTKEFNGDYFDILETVSFNGADAVMVVMDYSLSFYSNIIIAEGEWGGMGEGEPSGEYFRLFDSEYIEESGKRTVVFDNDTVTVLATRNGVWNIDYDYGAYIKVYPIYETEHNNTVKKSRCDINSSPVEGSYAETTTWNDRWYIEDNGNNVWFADEDEVIDFLNENNVSLLGRTVYLRSYHPYSINYNSNGATAGTMTSFNTTFDAPLYTAELIAPNFYKPGYGFVGWSEDPNASPTNGSKIYGPNERIFSKDLHYDNTTHETTLYAIWSSSSGVMQNWSGCSSLANGRVTALTDQRDSMVYTVAKLADGNCWMIENLKLEAANSSDSAKAQSFGGVFSGLADPEPVSRFGYSATTANSKYSTSNITGDYQGYRIPRYNNNNSKFSDNTLTPDPATPIYGETNYKWYSYGNYYTWTAAMANTTDYSSISASESANTSICPSGWRLPYGRETGNGNTSGGFYYLSTAVSGDSFKNGGLTDSLALKSYPNNFIYSCNLNSGRNCTIGEYWTTSSSNNDHYNAWLFTVGNNYLDSATMDKSSGLPVRCVMINH